MHTQPSLALEFGQNGVRQQLTATFTWLASKHRVQNFLPLGCTDETRCFEKGSALNLKNHGLKCLVEFVPKLENEFT